MGKFFGSILGILIVLVVIVVVAKDMILKAALEQSVTILTGFKTTVQSLQYSLPSTLQIKGLEIRNPSGFKEEVFVNMPEIYASLSLQELLQDKKIHLSEVRLNLQEVHIEKNPQGVSNVELLSSVGGKFGAAKQPVPVTQPSGKQERMSFQLDRLELTIRTVSYEDRSGLVGRAPIPGKKVAVDLNVQREVFLNITDSKALVNLILVKIFNSATLGRILDIDPRELLGDNAAKILSSGQQVIAQQAAGTRKAEALVGSSVGGAKDVLGSTAGTAKEQVSGLFKKLSGGKTLQPGDTTPEKT